MAPGPSFLGQRSGTLSLEGVAHSTSLERTRLMESVCRTEHGSVRNQQISCPQIPYPENLHLELLSCDQLSIQNYAYV